ncbi:hypothetical protein GALL_387200 [mine drainage metagenome]|uniref:NAD-specific glutamate dehydrogenase n=1 Tax=mine drainage metagenome TaxID=410659 RepID=A0A1J5Q812_9ZZZZ
MARRNQVIAEFTGFVQVAVRLGDHVLGLLDGGQVVDLVRHVAAIDAAVRCFQEAILVGTGKQRQRIDQADVRAFRRFDRTDAAVMGRMHVAHLEARALAGQAAGAKGRNATLVGDFGQRIGLVHELRQLAGAEELADRARHRLGIDQVMRHQVVGFCLRQALLDRALNAHQTGAELVFGQLAHGTYASVSQVIDVVDLAATIAQLDQNADHRQNVLVGQRDRAIGAMRTDLVVEALEPAYGAVFDLFRVGATVEFHPSHGRQIVALLREEQAVEQGLHRVGCRRLAWTHHAVDGDACGILVSDFVDAQRLRNVIAMIEVVRIQRVDLGDIGLAQLFQQGLGDLVVGIGHDFAAFLVDDIDVDGATQQEFFRHGNLADAGLFHVADVLDGDALVLADDDVAFLVDDVELGHFAAQTFRHQLELHALLADVESVHIVEVRQYLLRGIAQRLEQDRHRHLAATVDAEIQVILGIEFVIQPGAAVGNDPRRKQELAGRMGLAPVMLEEHARAAVQLGDDDALGAVDDERAVLGHQGQLAHVDLLLLDLLDGRLGSFAVHDGQAHLDAQRRGKSQAALLTFLDVEWRCAEAVADIIQTRIAGMADNRKHGAEGRLQAAILTLVLRNMLLQKAGIGLQLHRQQIRDFLHAFTLGETLADTFFLGERIAHGISTGLERAKDSRSRPRFLLASEKGQRLAVSRQPFYIKLLLLDFSSCAGFDQLLGSSIGISLGYAFLDSLGSCINQILGFLQAQAGQFAHGLDHVYLVVADTGQDDVELGLLFSGCSGTACSSRCGHGNSGGSGYAELFFHILDQCGKIQHGHCCNCVKNFCFGQSHL